MTAAVVWFTGLPASGKSTLAKRVLAELRERHVQCCLLDSDEVRSALVPAPGYDDQGRSNFYQTLARLAALLEAQGLTVLVAATANQRAFRDAARGLSKRFVEVYLDVGLEECRARDPKGLYARASSQQDSAMPGVDRNYDAPLAPEVTARGGEDEQAVTQVLDQLEVA